MAAIPTPEAGLIVAYSYLWRREQRAGQEEGRKDRPSVIVLAVEREADGATLVTVLPITHGAPTDPDAAIEIPASVKRHLGLDEQQSWIVVAEGNEFIWPGYDLRKVPRTDRYAFGFLPPRFFNQVLEAFLGLTPDRQEPRAARLIDVSVRRHQRTPSVKLPKFPISPFFACNSPNKELIR